jgi:hypothetical protein
LAVSHSELVVGADGWNGWAVHVSEVNLPAGTQFQPLSARFPPGSIEMQMYQMVFPPTPAKIAAYWNNVVQYIPEANRSAANTWLPEAAVEAVRVQEFPNRRSRFESIFGFRCGAEAIRFACHFRTGQMSYLYEFQPGPGTLMVDMKIWDHFHWDYGQPAAANQILLTGAQAYWESATNDLNAAGLGRPELLIAPPVHIGEPGIAFEREKK